MSSDLLDRMARNPQGDWTIADIERVCRMNTIHCLPPSGGGSHYKIHHAGITEILTIPARRPIKPKYVRLLVKFIRVARELRD